jgi:hypothetical protein
MLLSAFDGLLGLRLQDVCDTHASGPRHGRRTQDDEGYVHGTPRFAVRELCGVVVAIDKDTRKFEIQYQKNIEQLDSAF